MAHIVRPGSALPPSWDGHAKGSTAYARILAGLSFAGVATFAQLYSTQAVLPIMATDLQISAAEAALTISLATVGLAVTVIPWQSKERRCYSPHFKSPSVDRTQGKTLSNGNATPATLTCWAVVKIPGLLYSTTSKERTFRSHREPFCRSVS